MTGVTYGASLKLLPVKIFDDLRVRTATIK